MNQNRFSVFNHPGGGGEVSEIRTTENVSQVPFKLCVNKP